MGETQSRFLVGNTMQQQQAAPSSASSSSVTRKGAVMATKDDDNNSRKKYSYAQGIVAQTLPQLSTFAAATQCEESSPPAAPPPPPLPTSSEIAKSGSSSSKDAPPPPPPVDDDSIAKAAAAVTAFANPGPYEQTVNEHKRLIMLDTFDGFRCDINKQVSPFMAAIHSFHCGTTMIPDGRKSTYSFLTQVADETSLLMARIDPGRQSVDCRIHKATPFGMAKIQASVSGDTQQSQGDQLLAELDVGGQTWAGNAKYGSMGSGIMYGMNFIQHVHPNVVLGGEGMYLAANQNLLSSYMMKVHWSGPAATAAASTATASQPPAPQGQLNDNLPGLSVLSFNYNTGQGAMTVNFKKCLDPNRFNVAAELQFSPFSLDSQVLIGAEYKFQRSKLNLVVDGNGRIQSLLEAKLGQQPGAPSLTLSADVDHFKDEMRFGYGLTIDS